MAVAKKSNFVMDVIELEEFLDNPPAGFTTEVRGATGYRFVKSDRDRCCVFIDELQTAKGKVIFQDSPGRAITVHTLKEYMQVRKNITSKRIYILASACEDGKSHRELQRYVVVIDGANPVIKWEIERGLGSTVSSVAGESYDVDIDLGELVGSWLGEAFCVAVDGRKVRPVWKNTCFRLKYHSDALFDFPFWLGFSKRRFKIHAR